LRGSTPPAALERSKSRIRFEGRIASAARLAFDPPMCGKFTQMMSWSALVSLADLLGALEGPIGLRDLLADR